MSTLDKRVGSNSIFECTAATSLLALAANQRTRAKRTWNSPPPRNMHQLDMEPPREGSPGRVPPILHQTWRSRQLPRGLRRAVVSWRKLQPHWQHRFHTNEDNLALITKQFAWLLPTYRRCSRIQQADIARYAYMHAVGGVYADIDVELLQPLRPMLRLQRRRHNASVILGQEPLAHSVLLENKPRQVCNAVLASVPGHPFWLHVLRSIASGGVGLADPVDSTGPRMLERLVVEWHARHRTSGGNGGGGVVVLDADAFFPTWDPMQASEFRKRCSSGRALDEAKARICARLKREGFQPSVPRDGSAYTNHLWTHTWIRGAEKVSLSDTFPIDAVAAATSRAQARGQKQAARDRGLWG